MKQPPLSMVQPPFSMLSNDSTNMLRVLWFNHLQTAVDSIRSYKFPSISHEKNPSMFHRFSNFDLPFTSHPTHRSTRKKGRPPFRPHDLDLLSEALGVAPMTFPTGQKSHVILQSGMSSSHIPIQNFEIFPCWMMLDEIPNKNGNMYGNMGKEKSSKPPTSNVLVCSTKFILLAYGWLW